MRDDGLSLKVELSDKKKRGRAPRRHTDEDAPPAGTRNRGGELESIKYNAQVFPHAPRAHEARLAVDATPHSTRVDPKDTPTRRSLTPEPRFDVDDPHAHRAHPGLEGLSKTRIPTMNHKNHVRRARRPLCFAADRHARGRARDHKHNEWHTAPAFCTNPRGAGAPQLFLTK